MQPFYAYVSILSLIAVVLTCRDKRAAIRSKRRVSEKTLFLIALFGGSAAMYMTMLLIRHKTNHKRFMLGLPLLIAAQIVLPALLFRMGLPQG